MPWMVIEGIERNLVSWKFAHHLLEPVAGAVCFETSPVPYYLVPRWMGEVPAYPSFCGRCMFKRLAPPSRGMRGLPAEISEKKSNNMVN